jgi:hypothetical protein
MVAAFGLVCEVRKTTICGGLGSSPRSGAKIAPAANLGNAVKISAAIYRAALGDVSNGQEKEKDAGYGRKDHQTR